AMNAIISDLVTEMAANSTPATVSGVKILVPNTPASMVPERTGSSSKNKTYTVKIDATNSTSPFYGPYYANLIKQTITGQHLFTSTAATGLIYGQPTTSLLNTAVAAMDGRAINTTRWNMPMLIGGIDPSSGKVLPV